MTFYHPKYYKELRKAGNELAQRSAVKEDLASSGSSPARNKEEERAQLKVPSSNLDQAISQEAATAAVGVRPGPGLKPQATSSKPQAPSDESHRPQASSPKQQASSSKPQASSSKI